MKPKITYSGISVMIRALDGEGITFSKFVIGNGDVPEDYRKLEDLNNPTVEIELDSITKEESYVELKGTLKNSAVESGFNWTEIGVFCKDPDGGEDLLYAYGHYLLDDSEGAIYIPQFGSDIVDLTVTVNAYVGEVEDISAVLAESSEYATKEELNAHADDTDNPHKVTAEQVGLGNVPNVKTNDQTPTYSVASTLTALASGETIATAFGKIAKAVSSLISHLANTTAHITASERSTWNSKAAASHTHSASAITSGTLGLARGGTGATTAEEAAHSLYAIYGGTVSSTYRIASNKNLNSYTTGGTYWCVNGTTAATLKNCPYTSTSGLLLVFVPLSSVIFQLWMPTTSSDTSTIYFRSYNSATWTAWKKVSASAV